MWLDSVSNEIIDHLTAQIRYKAIKSHPENKITKEDVLCVLGVVSEDEILPAPSQWDSQDDWIRREQFDDIFSRISSANKPVIMIVGGSTGAAALGRTVSIHFTHFSLTSRKDFCFSGAKTQRCWII